MTSRCTVCDRDREHFAHGKCRVCYDRDRKRASYVWREIDEIAVERAVRGDPPAGITPRERREAVAILTRRRFSALEISQRLQVSQRAVERHRAALRRAA
jgi:hypothetical protein